MIRPLGWLLHPLFRRARWMRTAGLRGLELAVRPAFFFFRQSRPPRSSGTLAALASRTDEFNLAAERYYADYPNPEYLLRKPFSESQDFPRRLIDVGLLLQGLRIQPGDTILELGAGSCWLSHLLNRYGCRTISVDVSASALSLGKALFTGDPHTRWDLDPAFLTYDGRTLPIADAAVDHAILYDTFHHLPNPLHLLRELRRVLRPDGMVAMSEPGRGHSESTTTRAEASAGVLENQLALEDVAEWALESGFTEARVLVATAGAPFTVDAFELRAFMGGRGVAEYWWNLCASLDGHHYILLYTGRSEPTTKRPGLLRAQIVLEHPVNALSVRVNERLDCRFRVWNLGDTRWLAAEGAAGWTRLGAHLQSIDGKRIDYDWVRAPLPHDVRPGQSTTATLTLPSVPDPGRFVMQWDLVIEGLCWFADRESLVAEIPLEVR